MTDPHATRMAVARLEALTRRERRETTTRLRMAIGRALMRNSWTVLSIHEISGPGDGTFAHGVVRFHRDGHPEERAYGTAIWVDASPSPGGDLHFSSGHYDMSEADSLRDFIDRVQPTTGGTR